MIKYTYIETVEQRKWWHRNDYADLARYKYFYDKKLKKERFYKYWDFESFFDWTIGTVFYINYWCYLKYCNDYDPNNKRAFFWRTEFMNI